MKVMEVVCKIFGKLLAAIMVLFVIALYALGVVSFIDLVNDTDYALYVVHVLVGLFLVLDVVAVISFILDEIRCYLEMRDSDKRGRKYG